MGGGRCWGVLRDAGGAQWLQWSWQLCCGHPGDGDSPAVTNL